MVGDPIVLSPQRPDLVSAHARPGLLFSRSVSSKTASFSLGVGETSCKNLERQGSVLMLGSAVDADGQARRPMGRDDARVGLVAVLPAGPASSCGLDVDVRLVEPGS